MNYHSKDIVFKLKQALMTKPKPTPKKHVYDPNPIKKVTRNLAIIKAISVILYKYM
tara:strand:+ start:1921 stop:2088 length:168 start_codon:yes stop_codon:yes gene_type:complete